jgi:hypothetical protein
LLFVFVVLMLWVVVVVSSRTAMLFDKRDVERERRGLIPTRAGIERVNSLSAAPQEEKAKWQSDPFSKRGIVVGDSSSIEEQSGRPTDGLVFFAFLLSAANEGKDSRAAVLAG